MQDPSPTPEPAAPGEPKIDDDGLTPLETGGEVGIGDLCTENPEIADDIRAAVAAMQAAAAPGWTSIRVLGFEVVDRLGEGGMGMVLLARQLELDREVALKVMHAAAYRSDTARERFRREALALARLQHESIVRILEVGETEDGLPFMAMERVEGASLAQLIAAAASCDPRQLRGDHLRPTSDGVPSVDDPAAVPTNSYIIAAVRLIRAVADALESAHRAGIIHRDVKPANVLVRGDGPPVLVDFGVAFADSDVHLTRGDAAPGTPAYMAPEQTLSQPADARSDVYGLGVTLYHVITQKLPFGGDTVAQLFAEIRDERVLPPPPRQCNPLIPVDLETICLAAMETLPERRYQTAAELRDDLDRFLAFLPVKARPLGPLRRFGRAVRRHKARSASIALGLVLLVVGPWGLALYEQNARRRVEAQKHLADLATAKHSFSLARLAAQRGRWQQALQYYGDAERLGYADTVAIDLGRIEAFEGLQDTTAALGVLARLRQRSDLGPYRAQVLLWEGDLDVNRLQEPDAKLDLLQQALDLGGLAPADASYARAMLERSADAAIEHLRAGLVHDAYHRRGNGLLIWLLAGSGRVDEAVTCVDTMTRMYPDDPSFRMLALVLRGLRGEPMRPVAPGQRGYTERLRRTQEIVADLVPILRDLDGHLADSLYRSSGNPAYSPKGLLPKLIRPWIKLSRLNTGDDGENDELVAFRIWPHYARLFRQLLARAPRALLPFVSKEPYFKAVESLGREAGDPGFLALLAFLYFDAGRIADAEGMLRASWDQPSMFLSRHTRRGYLLFVQLLWHDKLYPTDPKAARAVAARALPIIRAALREPQLRNKELRLMQVLAFKAGNLRVFQATVLDRHLRYPKDAEAARMASYMPWRPRRTTPGKGAAADAAAKKK